MFDKIKQLKNLRDQAKQMQEILAQETVLAEAAGGHIKLVMNGNQQVLSVDIHPDLLQPDKKDVLDNAVKEAVNDAIKQVQRVMAQKVQGMGGLDLPQF